MAERIYIGFRDSNSVTRMEIHDRKGFVSTVSTDGSRHAITDNYLAVLDVVNTEIEFYDLDGNFQTSVSDSSLADSEFIFPSSDDAFYVVGDASNNPGLQKFDSVSGQLWTYNGSTGVFVYKNGLDAIFLDANETVKTFDDSDGSELSSESIGDTTIDEGGITATISNYWVAPETEKIANFDTSSDNLLQTIQYSNEKFETPIRSLSDDSLIVVTDQNICRYDSNFFLLQKVLSPIQTSVKGNAVDVDDNDNIYIMYERSDSGWEISVYDSELYRVYVTRVQADIDLFDGISVNGSPSYDQIPEANKEIFAQWFDIDGNFVYQENFNNLTLANIPEFTEEINGGANNIQLQFAQNYPTVQSVTQNNDLYQVDIRVIDRETPPDGELWYRGFQIDFDYEADENGFSVPTFTYGGYTFDMQNIVLEDSNGNTRFTKSNMEIGEIMKDLIDLYRNEGGRANYTNSSIDDTGVSTDFTVREETLLEAINRMIQFTPRFWYWFVTVDGTIKLKKTDVANPDQEFMYGRDLQTYTYNRSNSDIINRLYFRGGDTGNGRLYKRYDQTASQSTYGKRSSFFSDGRITQESSADLIANQILKNRSSTVRNISGNLIDSNNKSNGDYGHDLEAIKPGQSIVVNDPDVQTQRTQWRSGIVNANEFGGTGSVEVTQSGSSFTLSGSSTEFNTELADNRGANVPIDTFFNPLPQKTLIGSDSGSDLPSPDVETDDDRDFYNVYNESSNQRVSNFDKFAVSKNWDFKPSEDIYAVEVDDYNVDNAVYVGSATKLTKLDKAGNQVWQITGLTGPVRTIAVNHQYDTVWIADNGDKVKQVNTITGTVENTYTTADNSNVQSLTTDKDNFAYVGKANGDLESLFPDATQNYEISPHTDSINGLWCARNADKIYTGSSDNDVKQLEPDGTVNWTNSTATDTVTDIDGHPDNSFVYSVSEDAVIREIKTDGTTKNDGSMPSFTTGSKRGYAVAVDEFTTTTAYEDVNDEINTTDERFFWVSDRLFTVDSVNSDTDANITPINGWDTTIGTTLKWFYRVLLGNAIWNVSTWNYDINAGLGVGIQLQSVTKSLYDGSFEASEKSGSISRTIKELRARTDEIDGRDTPDKPS